jgi:hypothetical protein
MPGYLQGTVATCPTDPALIPGTIRVSLYSMTDDRFARAMINAAKRCVSVQLLMNGHLDRTTDVAWAAVEDEIGIDRRKPSWGHRCHGCRGSGVLHTKMYLFNSTLPAPNTASNKIVHTVFFGSSNMTSNASKVQWNDLYGVRNDRSGLYAQFAHMFDLLKVDVGFQRNLTLPAVPPYAATFWPLPSPTSSDTYMRALNSVSCTGASGAGTHGRTIVNVNMHAWFGTRGLALAKKTRSLYDHGCYVRVLYSFMSYGVFKILHKGTSSRMLVRRTIFSHDRRTAYVYSHFKNIALSGNVAGQRNAKVVWTGSNNFTNEGMNFDEVTVRLASAAAYNSYVGQLKYISARLSSSVYANFSEPSGGGRAPAPVRTAAAAAVPSGPPTITSPDVRVTDGGMPSALD